MTRRAPQSCAYCPHDLDGHRLFLLDVTRALGIVLCSTPGCTCGATWRAAETPSTPEQVAETRDAVRQIITEAGLPLPTFLK